MYGTCVPWICVRAFSISKAICPGDAIPAEAYDRSCAFAMARNLSRLATLMAGCVTSTWLKVPARPTGCRSRTGSNDILR
ncbi:hypothetical protein D3C72_1556850 [compost metagenome]